MWQENQLSESATPQVFARKVKTTLGIKKYVQVFSIKGRSACHTNILSKLLLVGNVDVKGILIKI